MANTERLTKYDAIFYYTDSDRVPMQANVAILVDGPIDYDTYFEWISNRIDAVPRMKCTLRPTPFHVRLPAWTPAASFNLDDHVFHEILPEPGDDDRFKALLTDLINRRIPLDRPLWRLHVVSGLADGRSALVLRWHHCMADAEGTLEILKSLLETRLPDDDSAGGISQAGRVRNERAQRALARPGSTLSREGRLRLARLVEYARTPGPDLPFFKPVTGRMTVAWRHLPLAQFRSIARAADATVSDVVLAALGSAVERFARNNDIAVDGAYFRVQVPANVRLPNKYGDLGNELAMLPGVVPLGLDDPLERLRRVAAYNRELKALNMAGAMHGLMGPAFGVATPPGQALLCRLSVSRPYLNLARRLQLPPHEHALMTSIVLPPAKYSVQGHCVTAMVNFVACQFNMGFVSSAVTYNDEVTLTLSADEDNLGDAERMIDYAVDGIDELKQAVERSEHS